MVVTCSIHIDMALHYDYFIFHVEMHSHCEYIYIYIHARGQALQTKSCMSNNKIDLHCIDDCFNAGGFQQNEYENK